MPRAKEGENDVEVLPELSKTALFDVKDKIVVVTGGGSGIGAMIAMGFAANGSKVYIVSRKDTSSFAKLVSARASEFGGSCISFQADLSSDSGCQAFSEEMERREPNGIHVLVNNSGTNWAAPIENYEPKVWDKVYALNVKGVFNASRLLLPLLEKCGTLESPANIINISSIDGLHVSTLDTYAYGSGKAAVIHMSKTLASKLAKRNITVNAVCPGPFQSRMMRATIEMAGEENVARNTALGRIGLPKDMAGVCIYLASPAGSYITGTHIVVDGGSLVKSRL